MKDKSCKLYLLPVGLLLSILHSAMIPEVLSIDTTTSLSSSIGVSAMTSVTGPSPKSTDSSPAPTDTSENPSTKHETDSSSMDTTSMGATVIPPASTSVAMTTIATTTTATTIAYSALKCRSFKCTGLNCLANEVNATVKPCRVGISHCELQKVVGSGNTISYEGGCSNTCATSKSSCASIPNANCFQECCNAIKTGCCMILDGQVHFNTAMDISRRSIGNLFSLALLVIFTSHFFSSL
ncbi:uncharacterized protein LOC108709570 [Xenopus laevis]|uniref:Uncharacterized protein n=2 Tax=Xenopus laevis TaxID=8355 RepID=A0A974DI18_XENLA|nr:uncharacterized protein LOC108709570 [Xenopus laevis]OCT92122.1 hypothetical protein XELAEV_18015179mg [Xenopus laevis]